MTFPSALGPGRSMPPESRSPIPLQLSTLLLALTLGSSALLGWTADALDMEMVVPLSLWMVSLSLGVVMLQQGGRLLGIAGVYLTYLAMAHLGTVAVVWLIPEPPSLADIPAWSLDWLDSPQAALATLLSAQAIALAALVIAQPWRLQTPPPPPQATWASRPVVWLGYGLILFAGVYLSATAFLGLLPIGRGYLAYREAMELLPGYAFMLVSLATGITFVAAAGEARDRWPAVLLMSLPCGMLVLSGNRGEILYPVVAGLGILAHRGIRLPKRLAVGGLAALFVIIPLIRATRTAADQGVEAQSDWSPDAVFTELGFTMRPLVGTLEWQAGGEEPALGRTYGVPVARLLLRAAPIMDRPTLEGTIWEVAERIKGQGYSVIAEGVLNGGPMGALLVGAALGVLFLLARRARTDLQLAGVGGGLAIGLNNIRNGFAFVPGQLLIVLGLVLAAYLMGRWRQQRAWRRQTSVRETALPTPWAMPQPRPVSRASRLASGPVSGPSPQLSAPAALPRGSAPTGRDDPSPFSAPR